MSVESPSPGEVTVRGRRRLSAVRILLGVFIVTVPLYTAGIALLEYLIAPRGISLGLGIFLLWLAATIIWLITGLVEHAFRFGLKSMLVATAVVAVLCFIAVNYVRPSMAQRRAINLLATAGVGYQAKVHGPAWLQGLIGAKNCQVVTAVQGYQQSPLEDDLMECLSGSPHVYELFIGNSRITDDGLRHLKGMTSLAVLDLPSNERVTNACFAHLPEMKRLVWLDASDVPVKDEGLAWLADLTQLEQIELNRAQITDEGLRHLRRLVNLRRLVLDKNQITGAGLKQLRGMKQLQMLSLKNTQISDEGLGWLEELADLRFLQLDGTKVSDAGVAHLAKLKNLSVLEVDDTQVTLVGLRTLNDALTKCTIIHSKWLPRQSRAWSAIQFNGYQMYRSRSDNPFDF